MSDPILQGHKTIAHKLCNVCTDAALDVWGIKLNTSIFVFPSVLEKNGRSLKTFCFKRKQKLFHKTYDLENLLFLKKTEGFPQNSSLDSNKVQISMSDATV